MKKLNPAFLGIVITAVLLLIAVVYWIFLDDGPKDSGEQDMVSTETSTREIDERLTGLDSSQNPEPVTPDNAETTDSSIGNNEEVADLLSGNKPDAKSPAPKPPAADLNENPQDILNQK